MNINSEVRVNWSMRGSINSIVRQLSRLALDQMSYSVALQGPLWVWSKHYDTNSHTHYSNEGSICIPIKSHSAFVSRSKSTDSYMPSCLVCHILIYLIISAASPIKLLCLTHLQRTLYTYFCHLIHMHSLAHTHYAHIFSCLSLTTCNNVWAGKSMLMCLSLVV